MESKLPILILALLLTGCAGLKDSGERVPLRPGGGVNRYEKTSLSWLTMRRQQVVMQGLDYSCGSAALATLMRYYFEEDVTEKHVLRNILDSLSDDELQERRRGGLSLLDLKLCAERMGYRVSGVRLPYRALPKLRGPVLIHLERRGNPHFAVLRGVRADRVYLADPSWGNLRMTIDRFACEWTGVALVLGKDGFGLPGSHPLALAEAECADDTVLAARRLPFTFHSGQ